MEDIKTTEKSRVGVPPNSIEEDDEDDDEDMPCAAGEWDMMHEMLSDSDFEVDSEEFPQPVGSTSNTDLPMHKYPFKLKQDGLG